MPDLLLELFSEEIPARMQARAAEDLRKLVTERLVEAGLVYEGAKAFATPRRLALFVQGVPARQPDLREERKGPRVGTPDAAVQGFLRSAGLGSLAEASVQRDPKKGDFYVALVEKPGRPALDVLSEMLPIVVRTFPWPKSMRWGDGRLTWVRPLHAIVATFGPETEEPDIVPFSVDGIAAGDATRGHRFLAPKTFHVKRFDDYVRKLERAKVVLDPARRKDIIRHDARQLAFAQGLELVEDAALLDEVAGLVEWPVVLMGSFDPAFLAIPDEVIRSTIRNNQKCFVARYADAGTPLPMGERSTSSGSETPGEGARIPGSAPPHPAHRTRVFPSSDHLSEPKSETSDFGGTDLSPRGRGEEGRLAPRFILVSNIEAKDGGAAIVAGNERVIRARLSDAKFFYETDLKTRLEDRLQKFKDIVFHEKLGTQWERIERIEKLAAELAPLIVPDGSEAEKAELTAKVRRAAKLCKADLLTKVVGEFPELQGLMGRYYAQAQGENASVAAACEEHYKPLGPGDRVPTDPVSVAVALADKIDTVSLFFWMGEMPTGSKDPYALRRAAIGIIRLVIENRLRLRLLPAFRGSIWSTIADWDNQYRSVLLVSEVCEGEESDDKGQALKGRFFEHIRSPHSLEEFRLRDGYSSIAFTFGDERGVQGFEYEGPFWEQARIDFRDPFLTIADLLAFFADRLKVQLREQGARHDLVDAVFALEGQDDLLLIVRRVEALGQFLDSEDGKNLLAGYKRATNIIRIEEKRDQTTYAGAPDPDLYRQAEEWELARAIDAAKQEARNAIAREDFAAAMRAMAKLRPHVDAYFNNVTVNVAEPELRANRLKLLNEIRAATLSVADFSKIEG